MDRGGQALLVVRAKVLAAHHGEARAHAHREAHGEVDQGSRCLDAAERRLAGELAHDEGVHQGIRLLEERREEHGHAQQQELPPDHALGDVERPRLRTTRHVHSLLPTRKTRKAYAIQKTGCLRAPIRGAGFRKYRELRWSNATRRVAFYHPSRLPGTL